MSYCDYCGYGYNYKWVCPECKIEELICMCGPDHDPEDCKEENQLRWQTELAREEEEPKETPQHPCYQCGYDGCWCHDSDALDEYINDLDASRVEEEEEEEGELN